MSDSGTWGWWSHVPLPIQRAIKADPRRQLGADEIVALLEARAMLAGTTWASHLEPPAFSLPEADIEWIEGIEEPSTPFGFWDDKGRWNPNSEDW